MPPASHAHVGYLRSVRVSGFGGLELALNGPYDLSLHDPDRRVYQRRAAGSALPDSSISGMSGSLSGTGSGRGGVVTHQSSQVGIVASVALDAETGCWVLRSTAGHCLHRCLDNDDAETTTTNCSCSSSSSSSSSKCKCKCKCKCSSASSAPATTAPSSSTESSPVGRYGAGGAVAVGAVVDWQSLVGHLAFPAPARGRDFFATRRGPGCAHVPLLAHPGLVMLMCGDGDSERGLTERVPAVHLKRPTAGGSLSSSSSSSSVVALEEVDSGGGSGGRGEPRVGGTTTPGTHLATPPARVFTVLYSHGNAEDLGTIVDYLAGFGQRVGCHVFCYDYVGYSTSQLEGDVPSEGGCIRAIHAAWDYLTKDCGVAPGDIVLYGRALGSGPTCALASTPACRDAIAGVILQSPILSGASLILGCGSRRAWLTRPVDIFRNYETLPLVSRPVAIMHGQLDEVVAIENGMRLHSLCQRPVRPMWFDGYGHEDLPQPSVERFVISFLADLARAPRLWERKAMPSDAELGIDLEGLAAAAAAAAEDAKRREADHAVQIFGPIEDALTQGRGCAVS